MAIYPVQAQEFQLYGAGVSIGDTSLVLKTFQKIDGTNLAMSDFGAIGYLTLEAGNRDNEEQVSFSSVTQNANGTATLGGIKTVSMTTPFTETSGFAKDHAGATSAIISDTSGFLAQTAFKQNNETISGTWTFSAVPSSSQAPVGGNDLARKSYVDGIAFGGTTTVNKIVVSGTAGETLAAGNFVYFKASDQRWWKTSASAQATSDGVIIGIAQGSGTAGAAITGGVLTYGIDINQSGLTAGTTYYLSNTAGVIATSAGTYSVAIGPAISTTSVFLDQQFDQQFTNFATKTALQNGSYVYAASSTGSDAYAVTLAPVPASYTTGMLVSFKADVANTGAATLNVNGLGAKTIKKQSSVDLATGDISAGQIITAIYDGTNFQISLPTPTYSNGVTTRGINTASGTQTIAHGLGRAPRFVRLTCRYTDAATSSDEAAGSAYSDGTYNGTNNACVWSKTLENTGSGGAADRAGNDSSNIAYVYKSYSAGAIQSAVCTVDATNITLTWTKTNISSGTENINIMWEAFAF